MRAADGRFATDLSETYTADANDSLRTMIGQDAAGDWRLRVRDLAAIDTGTLDSWTLKLVTG